MNKRRVFVHYEKNTYFVKYASRQKHTRHCAAMFAADMRTLEEVLQWIRNQPHLELVDEHNY
jgi:hypothetical protein